MSILQKVKYYCTTLLLWSRFFRGEMFSVCSSASCAAAWRSSACFGLPAPLFCSTSCCFWVSSWPPSPWATTSTSSNTRMSLSVHPKLSLCIWLLPVWMGFCWSETVCFLHLRSSSTSSSCGPFGSEETVFNVTGECVKNLPAAAQTTIRYLSSEAFALPLILAEMWVCEVNLDQMLLSS